MKVSIITAVLNRREEIKQSLDSLVKQTYKNIQHVIVDGESTDGTLEVLKNYKNSVKDYEIILVSRKDKGLYEALNRGLNLCTGDIIGVLHAGDLFAQEDSLEIIVNKFAELKNIDGIYGDVEFFNEYGKTVRQTKLGSFNIRKIKCGWHPIHTALFLKKSIYDKCGFYREDFDIASDYEYILRITLKCGFRLDYINKVLVKMKTGGKSGHTPKKMLKKLIEDWKIIRQYNLPLYVLITKRVYKIPEFLKPFVKL